MAVFQHRRRIPLWLQKHLCGPGCFSRDSRGSGGFSGLRGAGSSSSSNRIRDSAEGDNRIERKSVRSGVGSD